MNDDDFKLLRAALAGWNIDKGWGFWTSKGTVVDIPYCGTVTVVEYTDAEYPDGGTPFRIIFKVDDGFEVNYFSKSGYQDSYEYAVEWSGEFRQVVPKEKVVYEYV